MAAQFAHPPLETDLTLSGSCCTHTFCFPFGEQVQDKTLPLISQHLCLAPSSVTTPPLFLANVSLHIFCYQSLLRRSRIQPDLTAPPLTSCCFTRKKKYARRHTRWLWAVQLWATFSSETGIMKRDALVWPYNSDDVIQQRTARALTVSPTCRMECFLDLFDLLQIGLKNPCARMLQILITGTTILQVKYKNMTTKCLET